jgi:hypothetical protein
MPTTASSIETSGTSKRLYRILESGVEDVEVDEEDEDEGSEELFPIFVGCWRDVYVSESEVWREVLFIDDDGNEK